MQNNAKITVIIPAYNTAKFLPRCLDSILNNSYANLEIICIDDGSTDNTGNILDSYADRDTRVIAIHKPNEGVSAARNDGLNAATGNWICFIDSDDWIHPQFFEILLHHAQNSAADIVVTPLLKTVTIIPFPDYSLNEMTSTVLNRTEALQNYAVKNFITARLYRSDLVKNIRFERRLCFGEDLLFSIHVFCQNTDLVVCMIKDAVYYYFTRPDSLVHSINNQEQLLQSQIFFSYAQQNDDPQIKEIYLTEAMKKAFSARYSAIYDPAQKELRTDCHKLLKEENRQLRNLTGASMRTKAKFSLFSFSPLAYRLWRILSDPTLLQWENAQRKKFGRFPTC